MTSSWLRQSKTASCRWIHIAVNIGREDRTLGIDNAQLRVAVGLSPFERGLDVSVRDVIHQAVEHADIGPLRTTKPTCRSEISRELQLAGGRDIFIPPQTGGLITHARHQQFE